MRRIVALIRRRRFADRAEKKLVRCKRIEKPGIANVRKTLTRCPLHHKKPCPSGESR